jgi:hypothetical protein
MAHNSNEVAKATKIIADYLERKIKDFQSLDEDQILEMSSLTSYQIWRAWKYLKEAE